MLAYNHTVYGELVRFLKACTGEILPIYNGLMLTAPPKEDERIEFRLMNFTSTGQIYGLKDTELPDRYEVGSISEYRCQLIIRVFDDPKNCAMTTGKIAGAIQTFGYLDQFVNMLYVKNETMRIAPFCIQNDNIVINYQEIVVDCYVGIQYGNDVDYFTKVEDISYEVNSPVITIKRK